MSAEQEGVTPDGNTGASPAGQTGQHNLRVSDAEREHVVELLQKAIGRGMLELDEFSERTDTALAARTRGELNAVLVDLPGLVHQDAPRFHTGPAHDPHVSPGDRVELRGKGSSLVRKGRWSVPSELLVDNDYGTTKLDFAEADIPGRVVRIKLDVTWGTVTLTIPRHMAVDLNGMDDVKWSTVNDKTNSADTAGNPLLVITGRLLGSTLKVRYSRKR